jgi:hypothetical protein
LGTAPSRAGSVLVLVLVRIEFRSSGVAELAERVPHRRGD